MAAKYRKSLTFSEVLEELLRTLEIQNLPGIARSLTVFEINNIFHFRKNYFSTNKKIAITHLWHPEVCTIL